MNSSEHTPADLLRSALAADAGRPLVTYYDDTLGARVELSATTLANWVAKMANALQDDLVVERGQRLVLLLPAHWQTAAWLLACAATGVVAEIDGDPEDADAVVAGPDRIEEARACRGERIAVSLHPLGARFPAGPPDGFQDHALLIPGQGDAFTSFDPPGPEDPLLVVEGQEMTGAEVLAAAREDAGDLGLSAGARLLSLRGYDTWEGLSAGLFAPLAAGASVVLAPGAARLEEAALAARRTSEGVTHFAD
ncbi:MULTISPECIES: TIGR03089 family protein [unclassified Streptomyces]|uniref:TIGR03089 family protein n=1 Tax=Streptomyces TaxID=1883 RepID=UPI0019077A97|nr:MULTISPECIES: TIGR03089 family protein [unclassified Streptomyces]MCU4748680.1 TIGR03089 family protein [Streptomyces sp. G-5]QQN79182.1 TIGR03089 family protein [Streptomyces sp. XC 2026]